jgi:hypothetical protein
MLRGDWGAALHDLDADAYGRRVAPRGPDAQPAYVLRPARPGSEAAGELDWLLLGEAVDRHELLLRAWQVAAERGLGPARRPFAVRDVLGVSADGRETERPSAWTLDAARWPLACGRPCSVCFLEPVRLLRRGRLIERPTLADVVVAASRRVGAWLTGDERRRWEALRPQLLAVARSRSGGWQGWRDALQRYSASQGADLELRGVGGVLSLPGGVGELGPLLAAALWLHVGKGTVFGLGRMEVRPEGR